VALALALAVLLARRLAVAFEIGWHHVPSNSSSRACGLPGVRAHHFSGGPSWACGPVAFQRCTAPAAFQLRRTLANCISVSLKLAGAIGLALAKAASDNKSIDADAQVHPCAVRTRPVCAGHLQR
jgi:hypothetical protein